MSNSEWMAVVAKIADNSMVVSEATAEDKPAALVVVSVADRREIDSDRCWTVVKSVAETFVDMLRWCCPGAKTSDTATGEVAARAPVDRQVVVVVVARKMDRPETEDGFGGTAWVATVHYILEVSCNKDCCKDCSQSITHPDKIPHLLSAQWELSRVGTEEIELCAMPAVILERN